MPDSHNTNNPPEFGPKQSRDYKAYQEFIRCSYVNVYNKVTEQAYLEYFEERDAHHAGEPETRELAAKIGATNRSREAFGNTAKNTPPKATWNYYVFEK